MSDETFRVPARISTQDDVEDIFKVQDPFDKSWDTLKSFRGLDKNFKRRVDRDLSKATSGEASPSYLDAANAESSGIKDAKTKSINPGTVFHNGYGLFDIITPPYNMYELANFYDTSFANHASIDAKVENIVGLGYRFEVSDATTLQLESSQNPEAVGRARNRIERAKIFMRDWLENLNDNDSFTKTWEKIYIDLEATGNGFLEVGRTASTGEIGYLGHIPSTTVRVRRLNDGFLQIIGQKVVYFRNFGATNKNNITTDPRPNEIIHIKSYSPLNTFYGVPDIVAALPSLIGDQLASQYNIDYFENKAVPRYIITLKGAALSEEAEDNLFRFLQTGLKAQSHRTLYIPLPADTLTNKVEFKMEPIENAIQDGSFKEYRKANREDIFIAHQMPPSKIGASGEGLAAALSQDRTFKEQVARPAQQYLEKIISKIIKEKTDTLELKFNELTLTDEIAQSQILERYVKTQIMLPNEARAMIDLPQRKGGDEPFELKPQQVADAKSELSGNSARATDRTNSQSDGPATVSGRNPKGQGRSSE